MKNKVSIKDVAREAGVSAATVSYVLNDNPNVSISQDTRDKVLDAAALLKYVPNQAAKTLGSSRVKGISKSKLFGIVIPQTEDNQFIMFSNPFYGTFLSAVEYEVRQQGYQILVSGVNQGQTYAEIARSRSLDGIIIIGMYPEDESEEYRKFKLPVVLVDCYCHNNHSFHNVRTDDRYGGYVATMHLIEKGHRNIAIISGQLKEDGVNYMRYLGYLDALKEAGIAPKNEWVISANVGLSYGVEAAKRICRYNENSATPITAVFATSDVVATGVMKGAQSLGLTVPDDISIIGFDDVDYARMCNPGLTTIRQNVREKGVEAAKIMIAAANDPGMTKREAIIPLELVERDSVKQLETI